MAKLAVLAIGGNSIIPDKNRQTVEDQLEAIHQTVEHIVELIKDGLQVVITHGNGPQVGFILRRSEIAHESKELHPVPLKNCVADTQGALGYQIQESLGNALNRHGLDKSAVSLVTQVEVSQNDPSFKNPLKPIGSFLSEEKVRELAAQNPDWAFKNDSGRGWRRVVPSPAPTKIVQIKAIKSLVEKGFLVIAGGGGGIPAVLGDHGSLMGVDAVVDKDLTSSLMARDLKADLLVISTSVPGVYLNYGREGQELIRKMTADRAREYLIQGQFGKGSMEPKIKAAITFLEQGGDEVIITDPEHLRDACHHQAGTLIVP